MSDTTRIFIAIFVFAVVLVGPISLLLEHLRKPKQATERLQPDYDEHRIEKTYREMQISLKVWGWFMIVVNMVTGILVLFLSAFLGGEEVPFLSMGGAIVGIIMGIMFVNSEDAFMFGAYGIRLVGVGLLDLLAPKLIGTTLLLARLIWALVFFGLYWRYSKAWVAYTQRHLNDANVGIVGMRRDYTPYATWTGLAASVSIVPVACSLPVTPTAWDVEWLATIVPPLMGFSLAVGLLAISLTTMICAEKRDGARGALPGGLMGLAPLVLILLLNWLTAVRW